MALQRKTKLKMLLVLGIVLALGPILGTLPTVIGMVAAFRHLDLPGWRTVLEESVRLGMWLTLAGLVTCPIGIVVVAVAAIRLRKGPPAS